jgi:hypothetical protein
MTPSIETHLSRTLSVDTQLSDLFDDQIAGFQKNFAAIREPFSIEHAEQALENLYIGLSVEDGKLSQNGRALMKSILVEEGALEDLLWALSSKSRSAKFYRRACGCLAYFIRDNEERSTRLVEFGGLGCIVELMRNFSSNEVIQFYCYDLLGMLIDKATFRHVQFWFRRWFDEKQLTTGWHDTLQKFLMVSCTVTMTLPRVPKQVFNKT